MKNTSQIFLFLVFTILEMRPYTCQANAINPCHLFIEYRSSISETDAIRYALRRKYNVKHKVYQSTSSKWEVWILPNCNANDMKEVLLSNENTHIKNVGLDYQGTSNDIFSWGNEYVYVQSDELIIAKGEPIVRNIPKNCFLCEANVKKYSSTRKKYVLILDGFNSRDHKSNFYNFGTNEVSTNLVNHGKYVMDNVRKSVENDKNIIIYKINVYNKNDSTSYTTIIEVLDFFLKKEFGKKEFSILMVNMSFVFKVSKTYSSKIDKSTDDFLKKFMQEQDSVLLGICAAGNDLVNLDNNNEFEYRPASYALNCKNIITVAAVKYEINGRYIPYSNYGPLSVTVGATRAKGDTICSSYAAAFVTGLIAKYNEGNMFAHQIKTWIKPYCSQQKDAITQFGCVERSNFNANSLSLAIPMSLSNTLLEAEIQENKKRFVGTANGFSGRAVIYAPDYPKTKHLGKIVLDVCINQYGEVISVKCNLKLTTIKDNKLQKAAIHNVEAYRFSKRELQKDCGTITY